jgi:hypothetical protein
MELENMMQQLNSNNQNKDPIHFQVIESVRFKIREALKIIEKWSQHWRSNSALSLGAEKIPSVCST